MLRSTLACELEPAGIPDKSDRDGSRLPFEFRRSMMVVRTTAFTPKGERSWDKKQWKPNCNRQPPFDLNSPEVEYITSHAVLD